MVTALGEDAQVLSPAQRLASQELSGREGGLSPGSVATCLWMAGSDAQRLWLQRRKEPAFASCFLLPLPPPSDPPCLSSNLPGRCGAWPLLEMSGPAPSTLQRETGPTVPCLPLEWVLVEDAEAGGKVRCPPQAGEPARGSHAGRSLATQPQREPGRRNLSTCLINGGAETAAQTGLRQPHKEEAPRPLPPSIDPGPLWLGQRGHGEAPRGDSAHSH
uniref:Uncharacterized protein n=1 Tax=Rangifer tarandus platyrhynchus TaxID=3082113 RepID=A0ACB0E4A4_RANTA|nr:unnamed protein product [Rangifer tarandus platyrhynchus]